MYGMQKMESTKNKNYLLFAGIILSTVLITIFSNILISNDDFINGFGLVFGTVSLLLLIPITAIILVEKPLYDKRLLFVAGVCAFIGASTTTFLYDSTDYRSDCISLLSNELGNSSELVYCINYMNENPEATGSEVLKAITDSKVEIKPTINMLDRQLVP